MKLIERLRPALLRWDRLLAFAVLLLPFVAAMVAGFAWMIEHGWVVEFIVASISLGGLAALIRFARVWVRAKDSEHTPRPNQLHARTDPAWSARETEAFKAAQTFIVEKTTNTLPWEDLQPIALEVVQMIAMASGKGGKGILNFTLPEALLLIDRVTVRLRSDIRDKVPFSDSISVGTLLWLWEQREVAWKAKKLGWNAWRVLRAIKSPPTAFLREIEGVIAEGHSSFITSEGTAILQALLLEEVAAASVELYSGRLRFSDAELLDLGLAASDLDRARLAASNMPVRIAVAGQVSVGKSSLINALVGNDLAEVDVIATTADAKTYPTDFDGVDSMLLDMPGLDGSLKPTKIIVEELSQADLIVWVVRADRPGREIDRSTIAALRESILSNPLRRMPPFIIVVSCVDELPKSCFLPEGFLSEEAMEGVTEVVAAVKHDIDDPSVTANIIPVVLTEPDWNVDRLRARIVSLIGQALHTQRNRLRIEAKTTGGVKEAGRAGRGLRGAFNTIARKYVQQEDQVDGNVES
ncbi:GTPase family protein [Falsihalocynthiibacter sp. BN13B15]|uniref:GTPase family protein n=1 Tax=Falsihalocynthiibacter sp. BN13B15 TaxID=3240871 RepID=UPI00350F5707